MNAREYFMLAEGPQRLRSGRVSWCRHFLGRVPGQLVSARRAAVRVLVEVLSTGTHHDARGNDSLAVAACNGAVEPNVDLSAGGHDEHKRSMRETHLIARLTLSLTGMRVRIERTFLTTHSATRVIDADPESVIVESESLTAAILSFITNDHARRLGTLSESDHRVAVHCLEEPGLHAHGRAGAGPSDPDYGRSALSRLFHVRLSSLRATPVHAGTSKELCTVSLHFERRRFPRVHLQDPLPATSGALPVFVLDLSVGGLRLTHQGSLGRPGDACAVRFPWEGAEVELTCRIMNTEVLRIGRASFAGRVHQSGVAITGASPDSRRVLSLIVDHNA